MNGLLPLTRNGIRLGPSDDHITSLKLAALGSRERDQQLHRWHFGTYTAMTKTGRNLSFEELGEYSGDKVLAISIPFTVLTTIFLGLRFCSKRLMRSRSGLDDLLLVVAYFVNVGLCAIVIGRSSCKQCFFPVFDAPADTSTCSDDQNRRRRTSRSMGHKYQPLADRPLGPASASLRILPLRGRRLAKTSDPLLLYPSVQLEGQDAGNLLHDDGSRGCSLAGK